MRKGLTIFSFLFLAGMIVFVFFFQSPEKEKAIDYMEEKKFSKVDTNPAVDKDIPKVSLSDWNLQLVNSDHAMVSDEIKLGVVAESFEVDERIVKATEDLLAAAANAGEPLRIVSSYRSFACQQKLVEENIHAGLSQGLSEEEAKAATYRLMQRPGCSEHHTGLALDISKVVAGEDLTEDTKSAWLEKEAANFGFILRYPKGKEGITKIGYESWHYRFVGVEVAKYLVKKQLTLEEFIEQLKKGQRG